MAYELLNLDEAKEKFLYESVSFWKFKPKIGFNMMINELKNTTKPEEFLILKKFNESVSDFRGFHNLVFALKILIKNILKQASKLKMVKSLAPIIKFVNYLQSCFFKTLYKFYATNHSMRDVLMSKELRSGNIHIFLCFLS